MNLPDSRGHGVRPGQAATGYSKDTGSTELLVRQRQLVMGEGTEGRLVYGQYKL
jgi:hypothetical protein